MVHPPYWNATHTCTDRTPCVRGRHRDQHIPKHRAWPRQGIFARVGAKRRKEYHVLWAIGAPADRLTKSRAPVLQDTSVPRARRQPQVCHVLQGFRVLGRRATASATAPLRPGSSAPPVTQTTNQMPAPKAVTATAALPSQSTARHLRVISALSGLRCPLEKSARPVFSAPVERRTRPSAWLLQDPSALQAAQMVEGRWYAMPAVFTLLQLTRTHLELPLTPLTYSALEVLGVRVAQTRLSSARPRRGILAIWDQRQQTAPFVRRALIA